MSIQFFKNMDEKVLLEIQSYLLPSDSVAGVMFCKTIHTRFNELSYKLTMGYPLIIVVKNAAMFWKDLDDLARKYYAFVQVTTICNVMSAIF